MFITLKDPNRQLEKLEKEGYRLHCNTLKGLVAGTGFKPATFGL